MAASAKFHDDMPKHIDPPDWIKFNYGFIFAMVLVLLIMLILYFVVQHYAQNAYINANPSSPPAANRPAGEQQVQSF